MTAHALDGQSEPSIIVHPHGELTTYFGRKFGGIPVAIEPGISIDGFLARLGIPLDEVWLVAKNGEQVKRDSTLQPGDALELFAPVAGG